MLFAKLTKSQYDQLSDDLKTHYKIGNEADTYVLDISGQTPNEISLMAQNATASQQLLQAQSRIATLETEAKTAEEKVKLEYEAKLTDATAKLATMQQTQADARQKELVDGIANKFTMPDLFRGVLKNNIKVEHKDGQLVESFVDNEGKPVTLEALSDLYCKNKDYAAMLVENKSTPTFTQGQQAPAGGQQQQPSSAPNSTGKTYEQCVGVNAQGQKYIIDHAGMTDAYFERYAAERVPDAKA